MPRPILLALSSFRQTEAEVAEALRRCRETGAPLVALFVVDVNLARYLADSGTLVGSSLRQQLEDGLMDDQRCRAQEVLEQVCQAAADSGVECSAQLSVGRFAEEVLAVVEAEAPETVILTRARRPDWLRRLFGSPVERVCAELEGRCEVVVV